MHINGKANMATKDVPNIDDCREWILNIMKCIKDIDLFTSFNIAVRDFEHGYEGAELRKALKNLDKAYNEMKIEMHNLN